MANTNNIAECNNLHVDEKDFCAVWCVRCLNSDCSRALAGKGKFDYRVQTWEDRLFKNPVTMPETDPRFSLVSAKMFQEVPVGQVPNVRSWDVEPESMAASTTIQTLVEETLIGVPKDAPVIAAKVVVEPLPKSSTGAILGNTPAVHGQMLNGGNREVIVAPGGRVRLKG